jgi:hypothetical protein
MPDFLREADRCEDLTEDLLSAFLPHLFPDGTFVPQPERGTGRRDCGPDAGSKVNQVEEVTKLFTHLSGV